MINPSQINETRLAIQAVVALVLMLTLMSCSKLNLDNYNKIKVGMTYDEVVQLIGSPEKCDDVMGLRSCRWGNEKESVNVSFVDNKVLLFASQNLN